MEFTKADLRNWDIVVTREGNRYLVNVEAELIYRNFRHINFNQYDSDLKIINSASSYGDIMEVYRGIRVINFTDLNECRLTEDKLVYKRKEKWKPIAGERYYIPCINNTSGYDRHIWSNSNRFDKPYFDMNMVCKTQEDAINLTDKILNMLKNINND